MVEGWCERVGVDREGSGYEGCDVGGIVCEGEVEDGVVGRLSVEGFLDFLEGGEVEVDGGDGGEEEEGKGLSWIHKECEGASVGGNYQGRVGRLPG